MKPGDLVRYRSEVRINGRHIEDIFIVQRIEHENDWAFVYGNEVPIQGRLLEVISNGVSIP